ncbi:hypothetical protein AVEN_151427-1 [Araneus ventricosus]|uniref:Uncharacterized protein n=1 Tax=Araneus ventricosus TaxID=182803 RepID=A0A4Y2PI67_ARAVE|nr:hypothetical protein AVEN_151427-1 [Araneus ventricosus]
MSRRSRLPDSLRWRAVGWMEMGLSQADAASVPMWSNDSGININPKILCPCFRPTTSYSTCRRQFSSSFSPKEKKHYCAAEECPLLRCEDAFIMQVSMQGDQFRVSPLSRR